jgi:eukaryotic-like serine/threonine-protein kinase
VRSASIRGGPRSDCAWRGLANSRVGVHAAVVSSSDPRRSRKNEPPGTLRTTAALDASSPACIEDHGLVAPIGAIIGDHYRILDVLGSGGMGVVLRALDENLDREVAIKLVHASELGRDDGRVRFRAEARAMARVRHVNVVEIFAYGEHEDTPYFVMEYVPGSNLGSWMKTSRPDLEASLAVLDQICRGVLAIHDAGTLHRDLKPSNVLVGARSRIAVTDLGLAQIVGRAEDRVLASLVGTPAYLAPELARGETISAELAHRIDVYSLGCVAFELLTGRLPFPARGLAGILSDHAYSAVPRPSEVASSLPAAFDDALLAALAKDPRERTADVETFRRQMQAAFERSGPRFDDVDILVVDDDAANLGAMHALLEDVFPAASIRCARDGVAAMALAVERTPSVVVTDLDMPNRGGIELTASLRSCDETADVPIIVVTGQGGAKDWKVLRALGADRFLVKPIVPEMLLAELRTFMRRVPTA